MKNTKNYLITAKKSLTSLSEFPYKSMIRKILNNSSIIYIIF